MPEVATDLKDRIIEGIQGKKWPEVDEAWLTVVEGPPQSVEFHEAIIARLLRKKALDRVREMYGVLLDQRLKTGEEAVALRIIEQLLSHDATLGFLRDPLMNALKAVHKDRDAEKVAQFLKLSGIDGEAPDLKKALGRFEELLGATKGQVFRHQTWGLGVVQDLDTAKNSVTISFPGKANHKMTLEGVNSFLERIPKDHLYARMALDAAELKQWGMKDPAGMVRLALRSLGKRKKVSEIKKALTTRFLDEDEYKRWWNAARDAVKLDPWLELIGSGVNAELLLRDEPRSFIDGSLAKLEKAKNLHERREVLRDVDRHRDSAELSQADMDRLHDTLLAPVRNGKIAGPRDLFNQGMLFFEFADLFGEAKEPPIDVEAILKQEGSPAELIRDLDISELCRVALEMILECRADWAEIFTEVLPDMEPRLASWMEKEMAARGEENLRARALEHILARPGHNPELFVWASRNILNGTWTHLEDSLPPILILEELLTLLDELQDKLGETDPRKSGDLKNLISRVRAVLLEDHSRFVKGAVARATPKESLKLLTQIHLHNALADSFKGSMEQIIYSQWPDLRRVSKQEVEEQRKKPVYHYTTGASVDAKRSELSRILSVEIPETSKVIGTAREHGDLRENAEYHAAKERQKLLMQKAAELEELIGRARVVEPAELVTASTRFGTRVSLKRNDTGATETYTLLGIWEADPTRGIISYMTPFGTQLTNRYIGDRFKVRLPDGREAEYEVLTIDKAI